MTLQRPNSIIERLGKLWVVEPPPNICDWIDANYMLEAESSGASSDESMTLYPFQRGPTFAMANPNIPWYVEGAPVQVGKSHRLTALIGYLLAVQRRNVMIWQPDDTLAEEYSQGHIMGLLRTNPAVQSALISDDVDASNKDNKTRKRRFAGCVLRILGANTPKAFRQYTTDTAIVDDHDGCQDNVELEVADGAWSRTKAGYMRQLLLVSSLTTPYASPTWKALQRIARNGSVMRRFCRCPKCGEHSELDFAVGLEHARGKEPLKRHGLMYDISCEGNDDECAESAFYRCAICSEDWYYHQMPKADAGGHWHCEQSGVTQSDVDGEFKKNGKPHDLRAIGYTYSSLLSRSEDWTEVLEQYFRARADIKVGKTKPMATFYNHVCGKPSPSLEVDLDLSEYDFIKRLEEYVAEVPDEVQVLTLGSDLGVSFIDFEVIGIGAGWENWAITTQKIEGIPRDATCESWTVLAAAIERPYYKRDGTPLYIKVAFIDGRYKSDIVKAFCALGPRVRVCAQGHTHTGKPKAGAAQPDPIVTGTARPNREHKCHIARVGAHESTEMVYQLLGTDPPEKIGTPKPGYSHFPMIEDEYYEFDTDGTMRSVYFDEVTAEELALDEKSGKSFYRKKQGRKNEKHDCRKLAFAACQWGIQRGKIKLVEDYNPLLGAGQGSAGPQRRPSISELADRHNG